MTAKGPRVRRTRGHEPPVEIPQSLSRTVLPNGARIVTEEVPGSRSVALGVLIGTGSRSEKVPQGGSAHFIEHLLFKGTPTRTAAALAREIDSLGGSLDAFTSRELTCYYLNILVEHVEKGLAILSDILLNSTFPPVEIERERQVILEEIKMSEDSPEDTVYELLVQNIWPRSSLGRPILGKAATIASISRSSLLDFFHRYYRSSNLVLAAAGGMEHARLEELWRGAFPLSRSRAAVSRRRRQRFTSGFFRRTRDLEQTHLCFGTRGLPQNHEDRYTLYVLNSILGGTMSSRLFQEIREKRGLAYSVYSSHSSYRDAGLFTVSVGTSPHLAARVVKLVESQIERICSRRPTGREVSRAQDHLKGTLILSLESNGNRMMSLAKQEIYYSRQFGVDETLRGIEAVTPQAVQSLAARLFRPEESAWAAVGPAESLDRIARGR
jgi:predicted Zn-dependent peptidase